MVAGQPDLLTDAPARTGGASGAAAADPDNWRVWPYAMIPVALVGFLLLAEFGPLLEFDQWVMDISPYAHVPKIPGADFTATPMVTLTVLAALLIVAGLAAFRRRDIYT